MKWGRQIFYCNNCGARFYIPFINMYGGAQFKVCPDVRCVREMELKIARSTMGRDQ